MPTIKYDVSNVEDQSDFKQAPVGLYIGKIDEFTVGQSSAGQAMGTIVFALMKDSKGKKLKETYSRVWHRIPLEHSEDTAGWTFRLKEFVKALGLKEKGALNPDKLIGKEMQVKLRNGKDLEDNYRPEVGKLMALAEDEEPDDDEDEDVEEGEESEGYTEDDLSEMDVDELKEAAEEVEVDFPAGKLTAAKKKKLIAAILEAQEEGEDDEDDEDDDDDEDSDDETTPYDDMSRKELIAEARSRSIKVGKADGTEDIIAKLVENDGEGDDDDDDEDESEDDESEDYSEWDVDDLKAELKERGLKTAGSKKVLVGRLEKDDESEEDPF